jgi:nitrogen regulatory protein P-II 1
MFVSKISRRDLMKRIDAFVQVDNSPKIMKALKQKGFEGLTITQSLGRGAAERPWIGGHEGREIEFNAVDTLTIIVEDSKVENAVQTIAESGKSGSPGDGKIFISSIDDALDIHTNKRGEEAIAK